MNEKLQTKLKTLPDDPGVYLMHNAQGDVIYVGKAKNLKNRVRQYFQSNKNHTPKVRAMVENVDIFEYIVTDSELEALMLECNLIKKYMPKYNILMKDDKHYPFIKIDVRLSLIHIYGALWRRKKSWMIKRPRFEYGPAVWLERAAIPSGL